MCDLHKRVTAQLQRLRHNVEKAADACATDVSNAFDHSELALESGVLHLYTIRRVERDEMNGIIIAVKDAMSGIVADPQRVPIDVKTPHPFLFTRHFLGSAARAKKPNEAGKFEIALSELDGVRAISCELLSRYLRGDTLATFALGGVPYLSLLVDILTRQTRHKQVQLQALLEETQRRVHLFPGLNWSGTDNEKNVFREWLRGLKLGTHVTVFDTGKDGNGVRQSFNLAKAELEAGNLSADVKIDVLGLVSGTNSDQVETEFHGAERSSARITYLRVHANPAEDVEELIGYRALRNDAKMAAVFAPGVLTITDDEGEFVTQIAAGSAFDLLRTALRAPHPLPNRSSEVMTAAIRRFSSGMLSGISVGKLDEYWENAVHKGWLENASPGPNDGDQS